MLQNFLKTRGETLTETLVALFILALSIVAAVTLLVSSIRANEASRERIIAINIARTGLEAIHNIRDTNWLVHSADKRLCWNNMPNETCEDTFSPFGVSDNAIEGDTYYKVDLNADYTWSLTNETSIEWDEYRLHLDENGFYTHEESGTTSSTNFRRRIFISYRDDDGNVNGDPESNRMEVTSEVQFLENGRWQTIALVTMLSDYFGRTYLD